MKRLIIFFLIAAFFVLPAFAQAQSGLPPSAVEGLALAAATLAAFGGLLASMATDWLKARQWGWLTDGDKSKIHGWVAAGITGLFSIAAGVMLDNLARFATDLDTSGVWQVIVTVGPWIFAEIRYRWRARAESKAL